MFDLGAFKLQNERKNIDTSIFVLWSVNVMDLTRECVCMLTVLKQILVYIQYNSFQFKRKEVLLCLLLML